MSPSKRNRSIPVSELTEGQLMVRIRTLQEELVRLTDLEASCRSLQPGNCAVSRSDMLGSVRSRIKNVKNELKTARRRALAHVWGGSS
jgi:hypothetical protein